VLNRFLDYSMVALQRILFGPSLKLMSHNRVYLHIVFVYIVFVQERT